MNSLDTDLNVRRKTGTLFGALWKPFKEAAALTIIGQGHHRVLGEKCGAIA